MRHKHGWPLFIMFAVCIFFYYFGEIINFFKLDFLRGDIFNTVHDLQKGVFLLPVVYASYHFGIKGAVATTAIIFLSFLPRALIFSPYPQPLLRMSIFSVLACIIGVFTAKVPATLSASEERIRAIADYTYDWENWVGPDGKLVWINPSVSRLTGYSANECMTMNDFPIPILDETDRERMTRLFTEVVQGASCDNVEFRIRCKNGNIKWGEVSCQPIYNESGTSMGHRSSIRDITTRKLAEEALRASLQEKELLIREVHHRVKNNMQVMLSLLDLQARPSKNPELTEMLNEGKSRIRAMSLIHEKLYESKDFSRIDLAGYVRTLSRELFQAYKINPGKIDLIIQTDGAVYVDISKANPCGLILNELISNAFKHAFHGDNTGTLEIIIREMKNTEADSQARAPGNLTSEYIEREGEAPTASLVEGATLAPGIEIIVRDNGSGIPDDVDIHQSRSVGLHLVNGLVEKQLDGTIEVIRDAGTAFRITFPI